MHKQSPQLIAAPSLYRPHRPRYQQSFGVGGPGSRRLSTHQPANAPIPSPWVHMHAQLSTTHAAPHRHAAEEHRHAASRSTQHAAQAGGRVQVRNCWEELVCALQQAEDFIYIAGWSMHPETRLTRTGDAGAGGVTIGDLLKAKAQARVNVCLLVCPPSPPRVPSVWCGPEATCGCGPCAGAGATHYVCAVVEKVRWFIAHGPQVLRTG